MFRKLLTSIGGSEQNDNELFDESKLTDEDWVNWKRRCARNLGIFITDGDEVILASRHKPVEGQSGSHKELL